MLSVTRRRAVGRVPHRLAERHVGERHQHAAMDHAAQVAVMPATGTHSACRPCATRGRSSTSNGSTSAIASKPWASDRSYDLPQARGVQQHALAGRDHEVRNTSVRVWRETVTRISTSSPSLPAATKSQLRETVLQDFAPARQPRGAAHRDIGEGHQQARHGRCPRRSCASPARRTQSAAPRRRPAGGRTVRRTG